MQEAEELCEKIGIINDGDLILEGSSEQIKKSSSYYSKFIIKTIPDYKIKEDHQKYNIKNVGENEYEIYIQYEQEDNILYDQLRFDKKIIAFEKVLPTLEDAFMTLTGRELN